MANRVLVAYGSKHGSTAEIAERVGATLEAQGLEVDVRQARTVRSLDRYPAVVIGSAVYMGRWRRGAVRLLRRNRSALAERHVWLFSSGPVGDDADHETGEADRWTRPPKVQRLAEELGAHDHAVFGGQVDESGGFMRKKMAAGFTPEQRDRRDWDEIEQWAKGIASTIGGEAGAA